MLSYSVMSSPNPLNSKRVNHSLLYMTFTLFLLLLVLLYYMVIIFLYVYFLAWAINALKKKSLIFLPFFLPFFYG